MLHPRHKLEYFKTAVWIDDWIDTAETLVHKELEQSYSMLNVSDEEDEPEIVTGVPVRLNLVNFF